MDKETKKEAVIETEKELAKADKVEKVVEQPKELSKAEKRAKKFAKYKDVADNRLRANDNYNDEATKELRAELNDLGAGENPTAKYLVQHFEASPNADKYAQLISKLAPDEEFIPVGQGAEYGLTNGLAVNKLDYTKFIPQERNDLGNYTAWDNITLSANPNDFDKVELSVALYLYLPYYLSGKVDELASIMKDKLNEAMIRKQAKAVLGLVQQIFRAIHAKDSSGTKGVLTNRLVGDATLSQVDAMKEFLDFEFGIGFDNIQFNYGSDTYDEKTQTWTHTDYTEAYNSLPEANRVYVCEYQTYNNMKKYATTFLSKEQVDEYFKMSKWIVLPTSIYNNATNSPSTKGQIEQLLTLSEDNAGTIARVAGAVLVLDNRALKRVYNYMKQTAEYYAPNDTTQLFLFKNWAIKYLKWGQCLVYENSALESNFVVPTISQE